MSVNPPLSILTQYPYSPRNGTIADAVGVDANFSWIQSQVNSYMPSLVAVAVATLNTTSIVGPASSAIATTSSNITATINSASSQMAATLGPTAQATATQYITVRFNAYPDPVPSAASGNIITGPLSVFDGLGATFLTPGAIQSSVSQTIIVAGGLYSLVSPTSLPSGALVTAIYDATAAEFLVTQSAGLNTAIFKDSSAGVANQPMIRFANSSGITITYSLSGSVSTYDFSVPGSGLMRGNTVSGNNGQLFWTPS